MNSLRKVRIIVQILFFVPLIYIFIDFIESAGEVLKNSLTAFQFIPSLIKFITSPVFTASGFIFILILSLLAGRVYCSSLCPLGFIQDAVAYIKRKIFSRTRYEFRKENKILRYGTLMILIISVLSGTMALVNIFDPFSLFGRISFQIFRPVAIAFNNLISFILSRFGNYSVYPVEFFFTDVVVVSFTLFGLIAILAMVVYRGRWYCNILCPVGTLLGIFSRYSLYKFKIKDSLCTECGACGKICKSECIDTENKIIDMSRCVVCFNCTTVCNSNAIKLERKRDEESGTYNKSRRIFINKLGSLTPGLLLLLAIKDSVIVYVFNKIPVIKKLPVIPPGGVSIDHFTSRCTACGLCVSTCPTHVIQPSLFSYGYEGLFQPTMDFTKSFCNYDCSLCTMICPTGALLPLQTEIKKITQLGKAIFVRENCVVITQKTECGACSEHCPTKAVKMMPYEKLMLPEVRDKYCIGCGACEKACPTKPYKAIYVEGNNVHKLAEKNLENKNKKEEKVLEEFPF